MFLRTPPRIARIVAVMMALLMLSALAACGSGDPTATVVPTVPAPQMAQNVQVTLTTDPNPPTAGPVNLVVDVKDVQGKPVTGAKVSLIANHTGMSHGGIAGDLAELGNGKYQGGGAFTMSGTWKVEVKVSKEGISPASTIVDLLVR